MRHPLLSESDPWQGARLDYTVRVRWFISFAAILWITCPAYSQDAVRWPFARGTGEAYRAGDFPKAQKLLVSALGDCEKSNPVADECLGILLALGTVGRRLELWEATLPFAERAVELAERQPVADRERVTAYDNLARMLVGVSQYDVAERYYRKLLAIEEATLPEDHSDLASTYNNLSYVLDKQGAYKGAEEFIRRSLAIYEKHKLSNLSELTIALSNLAINLDRQGRPRDAEAYYRRALELRQSTDETTGRQLANAFNNLASNLTDQSRHEEAYPFYLRAYDVARQTLSGRDSLYLVIVSNLATGMDNVGMADRTEPLFRFVLAEMQRSLRENDPDLILAYQNVGISLARKGNYADAGPFFRSSYALSKRYLEPENPLRIDGALEFAGNLADQSKSPATSRTLYREADRGVQERMASFASFDRAAQEEIRKYRPIFTGQVQVAWRLAEEATQ